MCNIITLGSPHIICEYMQLQYNLYCRLCESVHNVSTFSQGYIVEYFVRMTFAIWEKISLFFVVSCS